MAIRPRTKTRKSAPVIDPALSFENLPPRTLPPVLTAEAVSKGLMPPLGVSALPPSLESGIPPEFRYWTAKSAEEAREVRDELVERGVLRASDILKVDGELRRVIWKAFLAEEEEAPAELVKRTPAAVAGASCLTPLPELETFAVDGMDGDPAPWTAERIAETVKNLGKRVCIALSDTAENRAALSGLPSTFALTTRPGVIYGSPLELSPEAAHALPLAPATKSHDVRLLRKAESAEVEERYVFGIVLEPDVVDSQSDTYSAEEVRKAAHRFMEEHAQLGQQHSAIVTGKLKILESYLAPVDFTVGEQVVKAGTWLLAIRVVDDELWTAVKAGSFTGFSIGGTAIRQPEPTPPPGA